MKKVLLISIFEDISSIGIRYLSSYLKKNSISVNTVYMPLLKQFGKFTDKSYSNKEQKLLLNLINYLSPHIIGISVMTNYT